MNDVKNLTIKWIQDQFVEFSKKLDEVFLRKNSEIELKKNTKEEDGYVTKGEGHENQIWGTDEEGNPNWRDFGSGLTNEDTPVGTIIAVMSNEVPKHYLACDGAIYDIGTYPYLESKFTKDFGMVHWFGGDGVNTYAVPDLRAEFLRGAGTAKRNTGSGGNVGQHQDGTLSSINWIGDGHLETFSSNNFGNIGGNYDKAISSTYKINNSGTISSNAGGLLVTSRPTNTSVLYCIKYEPTYYTGEEPKITNDYELLINQPRINGVTLVGNKTADDIGLNEGNPVGTVISFMGTKVPTNYLACDGKVYDIAKYPLLAQHFDDEFGNVQYFGGSAELGTFAVPDLRGEFLRGTGTADRNTGSGAVVGEHQDGTIQNNVFTANTNYIYAYKEDSNGTYTVKNADKIISNANYSTNISGKNDVGAVSDWGATFSPRPTNTAVLYCIKYQ